MPSRSYDTLFEIRVLQGFFTNQPYPIGFFGFSKNPKGFFPHLDYD
jgi:hypothetical protein